MTLKQDLAFDFRSDTVTHPSAEMKQFMLEAPLGDDVFGEDPSTVLLQEKAAEMLGFEAALFFPSGSMANLTALLCHASPGRVLYSGANSHVKCYEMGGYARIAGLTLCQIDDRGGRLDLAQLRQLWSPDIYYMPRPGLITVENTHNMEGGLIYPEPPLAELADFAREKAVPIHMDGARLMNAARAAGQSPTHWTRHVDSVMISISKGLGAPVGSVLAASRNLITRARSFRKLLGGGMRQTGVLAAAGVFALDHHLPLLDRDHLRCRGVYNAIRELPGLEVTQPQTNILIFRLRQPHAVTFQKAMAEQGFRLLHLDPHKIRIVFHMNNSDEACHRLADSIREWSGWAE